MSFIKSIWEKNKSTKLEFDWGINRVRTTYIVQTTLNMYTMGKWIQRFEFKIIYGFRYKAMNFFFTHQIHGISNVWNQIVSSHTRISSSSFIMFTLHTRAHTHFDLSSFQWMNEHLFNFSCFIQNIYPFWMLKMRIVTFDGIRCAVCLHCFFATWPAQRIFVPIKIYK